MKKYFLMGLLLSAIIPNLAFANEFLHLSVVPIVPIQGEAMKIVVYEAKIDEIDNLYFDGSRVPIFDYQGRPTGFVGIDLNKPAGVYKYELLLKSGRKITHWLYIAPRVKTEAVLGIPQKLGGNTNKAATSLVNNLTLENNILNSLSTEPKALWNDGFRFPLETIFITDPYGYSRTTGQYSIAHKGTDFRASEGTGIFAMNSGVVRLARKFEVYGNTVVIDHGFGIMTFYMHLSEISVVEGAIIKSGNLVGKSGSTGYAESPHLHISVRVNNTSVDPMAFMRFF